MTINQTARRRWRVGLGLVPAVLGMLVSMSLVDASAATAPRAVAAHRPAPAGLVPKVVHTGKAPTGYSVTFQVYDPTAARVRIKGEWSFGSVAGVAADPTNANADTGNTWKVGDFPLSSPNAGSAGNWPISDMVKDTKTGVWSYTTALPSGVFNYQFYADCNAAAPALTGCTAIADPANPPWTSVGSAELTSQVFVPSDKRFGTTDLSWQAPVAGRRAGTLTHVTYSSPGHINPTDTNYLSVYTPPGYNPKSAKKYPIFYLVHGGGGNEMDWSTQGDLKNVMDNLIAEHKIQPMLVVMPNNPSTPEVINNIIPFVQSHYNVQTDASGRSFAGLSGGATTVQDILFNDTSTFGYYAVWSAPRGLPTALQAANPALKELLGLHVGVAIQDLGGLAQGNTTAEQNLLTTAGVPFVSYNVNGGHNWSYWRNALRNFLTTVDFRATSVAVASRGSVVTAKVTSDTAHPATPTGKVQFFLNGKALGRPVATHDGKASILVPGRHASGVVKVSYLGNTLYNPSAGTAKI